MASPLHWALTPLRLYGAFDGRSTRTELACFCLFLVFVGAAFSLAALAFAGPDVARWTEFAFLALVACPAVALGVRRLHDAGFGGWWLLAPGGQLLLLLRGQEEDNIFGPNPRYGDWDAPIAA